VGSFACIMQPGTCSQDAQAPACLQAPRGRPPGEGVGDGEARPRTSPSRSRTALKVPRRARSAHQRCMVGEAGSQRTANGVGNAGTARCSVPARLWGAAAPCGVCGRTEGLQTASAPAAALRWLKYSAFITYCPGPGTHGEGAHLGR
jgi:hypothetical protein